MPSDWIEASAKFTVIASGAKQSKGCNLGSGLLRRFAPRNDEFWAAARTDLFALYWRIKMSDLGPAAMGEILEDIEDALLYRARAGEPTIPHGVVEAIHKGVHPVRAWRTHRGLTLQQVAKASRMPVGYLSEIETGKKPGSIAAFKSLARALQTEIDMLVTEQS